MEDSILISVKKNLAVEADYDVFDGEIITHINTAFFTLYQLGIGPTSGFTIDDDTAKWQDFLALPENKSMLSAAKTYVYLRVRLLFDPPSTSYAITSFENQLEQLEVRMNIERETTEWVDPMPVVPDE